MNMGPKKTGKDEIDIEVQLVFGDILDQVEMGHAALLKSTSIRQCSRMVSSTSL